MVDIKSVILKYERFISEANHLRLSESIGVSTRERLAITISVYKSVIKDMKELKPNRSYAPPKKRGRPKKSDTMKILLIFVIILFSCRSYGQASDTLRCGDTVRIETWYPVFMENGDCQTYEIYMPSFYGGVVKLNDSTTLYKAMFGVLGPLPDSKELAPRVYRFNYSSYRLTLYRSGAWIREKQINGKWTIIPY